MKTEVVIDYAMPLMNIERMAKHIHHLCLEGDLKSAQTVTIELLAESKILLNSLKHMQEKEPSR
jgi:hypothetical protein